MLLERNVKTPFSRLTIYISIYILIYIYIYIYISIYIHIYPYITKELMKLHGRSDSQSIENYPSLMDMIMMRRYSSGTGG